MQRKFISRFVNIIYTDAINGRQSFDETLLKAAYIWISYHVITFISNNIYG